MQISKCDEKGRIYLKQEVRSRYGDRFVVLEVRGELILLPVPKDPVKDLEELGKALKGKSMEELKASIAERARKEVIGKA